MKKRTAIRELWFHSNPSLIKLMIDMNGAFENLNAHVEDGEPRVISVMIHFSPWNEEYEGYAQYEVIGGKE